MLQTFIVITLLHLAFGLLVYSSFGDATGRVRVQQPCTEPTDRHAVAAVQTVHTSARYVDQLLALLKAH